MIKYEFWSMLVRFTHIFVCYNENSVTINIVQISWKSKNNEFSMQNLLKLSNVYIISTSKHEKYEFCIGGYGTQMPLCAWSVSYRPEMFYKIDTVWIWPLKSSKTFIFLSRALVIITAQISLNISKYSDNWN